MNNTIFQTPEKKHSATEPITKVPLGSDTMQYQHNTATNTKRQKLSPFGK